jgi:hypothetical protein
LLRAAAAGLGCVLGGRQRCARAAAAGAGGPEASGGSGGGKCLLNFLSVLACGTHLLSAPSQDVTPQWPWQISFRLQLRGSDGLVPSSLLTALGYEATWLSSSSKLGLYPNASSGVLSREIWRAPHDGQHGRTPPAPILKFDTEFERKEPKTGCVLVDNFTLQGSYRFLKHGDHGPVTSQCLATLLDAVVLYDEICIPKISTESQMSRFNGIYGKHEDETLWEELLAEFGDILPIKTISTHIPRLQMEVASESKKKFLNQNFQLTVDKASEIYRPPRDIYDPGIELERSDAPYPSYG